MESHSALADDEKCGIATKILKTMGLGTQRNQEWMKLNSVRMGTGSRNRMSLDRNSYCSKMMQGIFYDTLMMDLKYR
jgi:hypothetical protein